MYEMRRNRAAEEEAVGVLAHGQGEAGSGERADH